ncbi:hypothetical protein D9615_010589 [Tricholomella constricta]|uniref:Uncharacterized protein n=1 Tax=Tricholomella constricta TaxID=117010 RepID=A0A8H5LSD0_9AGAR|nr:hypothetical protein D9615_010592 [Tricholomella constricta]KAF5367641.1 hypothetical protein D9615_010589 [Tricholomella constricta]
MRSHFLQLEAGQANLMGLKTRSGVTFSPYDMIPIYCAKDFDFASLLQQSTRLESEDLEDDNTTCDAAEVAMVEHEASSESGISACRNDCGSSIAPQIPEAVSLSTSRRHSIRRKKRALRILEEGHVPRSKTHAKYVRSSFPIATSLKSEDLPTTKGAYSATNTKQTAGDRKAWTVDELLREGLSYVHWDGFKDMPLIDSEGRIIAVLVGQPNDSGYAQAVAAVYDAMACEAQATTFHQRDANHRRGDFPALNVGVTYGKGTIKPVTINNHGYSEMVSRLLSNKDLQRLAAFDSASFQLWAPDVYGYYKSHLDPLWAKMPDLRRNFKRSIFTSAAFNFGPNVWTFRHRDAQNCPFGWCAIKGLGPYDSTKGGHLILWELDLVIEFPSGALALIPSATISHSNVPVQPGDSRASFTQYCAGGLFRYVDNGFKTEGELEKMDKERYQEMCEMKKTRWEMGLSLLSKFDDIVKFSSTNVPL